MGRTKAGYVVNNTAQIMNDAISAHEKGITYGQYKAGISKISSESEYKPCADQFVRRSSPEENDGTIKLRAFIK